MKTNVTFPALAVVMIGAIVAPTLTVAQHKAPKAAPLSFAKDIGPAMTKACAGCHTGAKAPKGLDLSSYAGVMKGAKGGVKVIVPGHPDKSILVGTLHGKPILMPPKKALDKKTITMVELWVKQGAKK